MKKELISILLIMIVSIGGIMAQEVDVNTQAYGFINQEAYFELDELVKEHRNEMQPLALNLSEAVLGNAFNRLEEGIEAINNIVDDKGMCAAIGLESTVNFVLLQAQMLGDLNRYEEATEALEKLKESLSDEVMSGGLGTVLNDFININKGICKAKSYKMKRPKRDVTIPFEYVKIGEGNSMFCNAKINGKEIRMIFDTGNPKYSVINRELAEELGVKILVDSIPLGGVGMDLAQIGVAKKFELGDIKLTNALFYVVENISPVDSIEIEPVLGSALLSELGQVDVYPQEGKLVFPYQVKEQKHNMLMNNRHLLVRLDNGEFVQLDTGASNSQMNHLYYESHKEEVESIGVVDTIRIAGFGGVSIHNGYKIPSFEYSIDGKSHEIKDMLVYTIDLMNVWKERGCFGANIFKYYDRFTINYKYMYIDME